MLNSENERTSELPRLDQCPKLAGSRMAYRSFVHTLSGKGLVRFSRTPKFHCACFFVHEKQGRQRVIVDAREVNRHFKRLPSVALDRPEATAGLDCNASSRFWISTVDVRDAFHRMALPDDLSDCFALPGGTAREFNVRELQVSRSTVTISCGRAASACPWGSVGSLPGAASHDGGGGGGHRYHREQAPPRPTGPWSRARAERLRLHRQHRSH